MGRSNPRRNVYTHLTAAIVVPGCIALCWWQVTRALSGNTLSWAYVFEWPIFGAYGAFMWWKLIHDQPAADRSEPDARPPSTDVVTSTNDDQRNGDGDHGVDDPGAPALAEEDEELASYNRYLAALHASGRKKQW